MTGFRAPPPYQNIFFGRAYSFWSGKLNEEFGCQDQENDCIEEFARWVQATHWYCNSRWAFSGAMKTNPDLGPLYPMQFEVPNCDEGTKSCHCGEGAWIHGSKAWNNELGKRMKDAWAVFYKSTTGIIFVFGSRIMHTARALNSVVI